MHTPTSAILIEGLRIHARHGVNPQEKIVGNEFEINLKLEFDAKAAMESDAVANTLNYADIIELVKKCMAQPSELLENAVHRIVRAIEVCYPSVSHGSITLYKLHPPLSAQLARVGFSYCW